MAYSFDQFSAECRRILGADSGPAGREKVCALVKEVLKDERFVADNIDRGDIPERKVVYEDPDLGFCILFHAYSTKKQSSPHDHGPSWAIYGQARGETLMEDFELVEPARDGKPGKVRQVRSYSLTPGAAYLYNEGDLHAPRRDGPTRLLRIEGTNMDRVKRAAFELV